MPLGKCVESLLSLRHQPRASEQGGKRVLRNNAAKHLLAHMFAVLHGCPQVPPADSTSRCMHKPVQKVSTSCSGSCCTLPGRLTPPLACCNSNAARCSHVISQHNIRVFAFVANRKSDKSWQQISRLHLWDSGQQGLCTTA